MSGCKSASSPDSQPAKAQGGAQSISVGGQPLQTITRARLGDGPQFLSETIATGRGMNTLQITAYVPGKGEIPLLATPALPEAASILNADDARGNKSFSFGGAFLAPFANRITQVLSADKRTVTPEWHTDGQVRKVTLIANWKGKLAAAVEHAMHGLILASAASDVKNSAASDGGTISGVIHGGDFGGHWFSQSDVQISSELTGSALTQTVTVTNVGQQSEPVGIAWHPYFAIPSGDRTQVRLHIPSDTRAEVNNYDDVFVTGKLLPVKGTPYDFNAPGGAPLNKQFLDDNWVNLKKAADGSSVTEIIDPAAHYGLRITALSPEVNTYQVYAPPDRQIVVIEPQFNWNDPFGKQWHGKDTHMVTLAPGKSVTWKVRLELFTPKS
jgi:galactose mutarotase-like enzyme